VKPTAGQSTAERYAARILPGYKADQALREQARMNELRARGIIAAETDEPDDEVEEGLVEVEDVEEEDVPLTTAQKYAAVEVERRAAERKANVRAQAGAVGTMNLQPSPRRRPVVAQPHNYAHVWQKPTP
jgi:hypothetical protein